MHLVQFTRRLRKYINACRRQPMAVVSSRNNIIKGSLIITYMYKSGKYIPL